jgi:broad specificity phosphatase PhoE/8-oxo-dGTP pyrophosphatase MutT (NUDIX family)
VAKVRAAGGVLWREIEGEVRVAVVHRPRYDDWSLPKGKLDQGELEVAAAVREVEEETGFTCVVGRGLGVTRYRVLDRGRDVPKRVRWWALEAREGAFVPDSEVDRLDWLTVPQALRRVTAGMDDGTLQRFAACPRRTSTVLLVRHALAGRRDQWAGDDAVRPLDEVGGVQARALGDLLPLWAPTAVLSAPALRCRQTVAPAAERLGLRVQVDHDLAEDAAERLPGRLRALGATGETVVACSQGGAIGAAVAELTAEAGLDVAETSAPKGSVWALSFADGRLVDADRTTLPDRDALVPAG